jgi:outer membrane protein TolC
MRYICALFLLVASFTPSKSQDILSQEISYPYLDKLIETAKKNYPRIKQYQARVEAGSFAEKKAKLSYFEILSFSYLYSPDRLASSINPNFLNGYQFGFFVNIGSLLQKPSLIKQAKSEMKALEYDRDSYVLNLEADVKRRYFTYVQYRMLLKVKANALQDVQEMAEELKIRFEKGESSFEEFDRAQVAISDRLQSKIAAEADLLISKSALEELLGQKLEDIQ